MEKTEWDQRYKTSELIWTAQPNRFVVEHLAELTPGRALDLGTGEGRNAVWLAERGWRTTGVDFSTTGLEKAGRLAGERGVAVEWVTADLREYSPEPGAHDLVLIAYMHLPPDDLAKMLRRAVTAVAPGGRLMIVGHDVTNLDEGVGGPRDPRVLYTPESIAGCLEPLTISRAGRVRRPVATDAGTREAIDTLVIASRDTPLP
ncbi:class I SAM-dependent methyltransferase [Sphaerisporangium perillae]|uniref:class I SAM-dependent methyltransferase n=1 Tax=Sphaerisporangium perillae TaxID=2935860 RepID=UPI00200FE792|nr:class I SAM-dependent methyltransferase [Sphaerisporangium perillae]